MRKLIDLTNKKFCKLTVIKWHGKDIHGKSVWLCKCECGAKKAISSNNLRMGFTRSCGKYECQTDFVDLTNKKFGKLVVLKFLKTVNDRSIWLCKCQCGAKKTVYSGSLIRGNTSSCGKYECRPNYKSPYETIPMRAWKSAKAGAARRFKNGKPIPFKLRLSEYSFIGFKPCVYCGEFSKRKNCQKIGAEINFNTVDRIDSSKGYTLDNCQPACFKCNMLKSDYEEKEFISQIQKIAKFTKNVDSRVLK